MADRRKIRKMKKEFEKLVKQFGTDNLCNPIIIEKSIELEKNIAELKKRIQKMLDGRGAKREWIEQFKEYRNVNELDRIMLVLLVEKVLVYEKNRVEIIFRFKDEFETTMNYIRTMERCGRLTPSKEADERVVV